MKTTKIAIVFLFALFLNSCSKSEDTTPTPTASIIGKWEILKSETRNTIDNSLVVATTINPLANCTRNFLQFNANNTILQTDYGGSCVASNQNFTYELTNTALKVTNTTTQAITNKTVVTLSNTELVTSQPTAQFTTYYFYQKAQ